MRASVLFVDDEPNILSGLRRMLRPMRDEWDMRFALSGEEALEMLADAPADVVVSDMRMPGMDGAELLREVQLRFPATIRIVLSGQSDASAAARSVEVAHRILTKPCDAEVLKDAIGKVKILQARFGDNAALRKVVISLTSMPSVPEHIGRVLETLNGPEPQLQDICDVVDIDVGMTAKMLQAGNSPFFGPGSEVTSASEALGYVGVGGLAAVLRSMHKYRSERTEEASLSNRLRDVNEHSVKVARLASSLVVDRSSANVAYSAGLLHRVGGVVLAIQMPEIFDRVAEISTADPTVSHAAIERELIGVDHVEVGAYLLALWGVPDVVVEAVARHHDASLMLTTELTPMAAVFIAEKLVDHQSRGTKSEPLDSEWVEALGLTQQLAAAASL